MVLEKGAVMLESHIFDQGTLIVHTDVQSNLEGHEQSREWLLTRMQRSPLGRRWPVWPTQRTPRHDTRHACQAQTLIREFKLGWHAVQWAKLSFGSQEGADVSQKPIQATPRPQDSTCGSLLSSTLGSFSIPLLVPLLSTGPGVDPALTKSKSSSG
eukprot:632684-Pelagomonas_calceolata.AAC.11